MKNIFLPIVFFLFTSSLLSQDLPQSKGDEETPELDYTFMGTRVINGHSVDLLEKGIMEF